MPARIAVISTTGSNLIELLTARPDHPLIASFTDLSQGAAILEFEPNILIYVHENPSELDLGALRMLAAQRAHLEIVLAASTAAEATVRPRAESVGAWFLPHPAEAKELVALLSALRAAPSASTLPAVLDLVRGLCDEVNNPLQIAQGHMQLLRGAIEAERTIDAQAQVEACAQALARIASTLRHLELLATAGMTPAGSTSLTEPLQRAIQQVSLQHGASPSVVHAPSARLALDAALLQTMLDELLRLATDLAVQPADIEIRGSAATGQVKLTISVLRPRVADWRLPRSFAPFYISRALRNSGQGLGPFVVQTIAHAVGGSILSRRRSDGGIEFELTLPTAS